MRLILVRHGQTICNVRNVWHGWDDCELTAEGRAQARAVADRLAGENVAAIYCSDSLRAVQTARAIAAPHHVSLVLDPGLRERHAGAFEGLSQEDLESRYPTIWQDRDADLWGWGPPDGEAFCEVLERGLAVIGRLQKLYPDDTVIVVTHMSMVRALISELGHMPVERTYAYAFPSTGVTVLQIEGNETRLDVINDASHVPEPVSPDGPAAQTSP